MSKEIEMDQNTLQPLMLESQVIKEGQHIAIKELYAAGSQTRLCPGCTARHHQD